MEHAKMLADSDAVCAKIIANCEAYDAIKGKGAFEALPWYEKLIMVYRFGAMEGKA